jgi:hypothetical protein
MHRTLLALLIAAVPPLIFADACLLKGEKTDGMYKTCYYRCAGGEKVISIKSTELCPLSIN